jgi:hypothetical protein
MKYNRIEVCGLEKDRQETWWSWHNIGVRGPEKGRVRFWGTDDKEFQERCGQGVLGLRNRAGTSGAASWRGTAWPLREPRTVV